MLAAIRSDSGSRQVTDLGRTEIAARLAMATLVEDSFASRPQSSPYGWFSVGLALTGVVLGGIFLFGPL